MNAENVYPWKFPVNPKGMRTWKSRRKQRRLTWAQLAMMCFTKAGRKRERRISYPMENIINPPWMGFIRRIIDSELG